MNKCPNCKKENPMRPFEGRVKLRGVEVTSRGLQCSNCREVLYPLAEVARQEKEAAAVIVSRGIRDGKEFQFVRKMADLKATELAELLDVQPKTISRWETGETPVDRAAAFALGELYDRPRVVRAKLEALAARV